MELATVAREQMGFDCIGEGLIKCHGCGAMVPSIEAWMKGEKQPRFILTADATMHNPGCGACHDPETMEHLHRLMEGWGREEQERYKLTVGELLDSINQILNLNVTAEDLVKVAEIGQLLFYEAVCTADEQDNAEFLAAAYGFYGPLVDTVVEECGREHRDTLTGAARVSR